MRFDLNKLYYNGTAPILVVAEKARQVSEPAQFTKSSFGGIHLIDTQGHRYFKNRTGKKRIYWTCVYLDKRRGECRAKVATDDFEIVSRSCEHNHEVGVPNVERVHGNRKKPNLDQ